VLTSYGNHVQRLQFHRSADGEWLCSQGLLKGLLERRIAMRFLHRDASWASFPCRTWSEYRCDELGTLRIEIADVAGVTVLLRLLHSRGSAGYRTTMREHAEGLLCTPDYIDAYVREQRFGDHDATVGLRKFSTIASQVRPTANPLPFSSWPRPTRRRVSGAFHLPLQGIGDHRSSRLVCDN
jgi:hypothetical protein